MLTRTREWNPAKLREARVKRGLSQEALAQHLTTLMRREAQPVRTRNIVRWERPSGVKGASTPHVNFIPPLAEALGVSQDDFFGDDDEEADEAVMYRAAYALDRSGQHEIADLLRERARRAGREHTQEAAVNENAERVQRFLQKENA